MAPPAMVKIHIGKQNTHTCIQQQQQQKGQKRGTANGKVLRLPINSLSLYMQPEPCL